MDSKLPLHTAQPEERRVERRKFSFYGRLVALCLVATLAFINISPSATSERRNVKVPQHADAIQARCRALNTKPGPPSNFYDRSVSDRFVPGTRPVLLTNATIWTGRVQGLEILKGDIYIDGGILKSIGRIDHHLLGSNVEIIDVGGAFVTPG